MRLGDRLSGNYLDRAEHTILRSRLRGDRDSPAPDMITVAKCLTSGYAPLAAALAGLRVADPFWRAGSTEAFRHGYACSVPLTCGKARHDGLAELAASPWAVDCQPCLIRLMPACLMSDY